MALSFDIESELQDNIGRFRTNLNHIIEKYDRPFDSDEIELRTLSIVKDEGHLTSLEKQSLGKSKPAVRSKKDYTCLFDDDESVLDCADYNESTLHRTVCKLESTQKLANSTYFVDAHLLMTNSARAGHKESDLTEELKNAETLLSDESDTELISGELLSTEVVSDWEDSDDDDVSADSDDSTDSGICKRFLIFKSRRKGHELGRKSLSGESGSSGSGSGSGAKEERSPGPSLSKKSMDDCSKESGSSAKEKGFPWLSLANKPEDVHKAEAKAVSYTRAEVQSDSPRSSCHGKKSLFDRAAALETAADVPILSSQKPQMNGFSTMKHCLNETYLLPSNTKHPRRISLVKVNDENLKTNCKFAVPPSAVHDGKCAEGRHRVNEDNCKDTYVARNVEYTWKSLQRLASHKAKVVQKPDSNASTPGKQKLPSGNTAANVQKFLQASISAPAKQKISHDVRSSLAKQMSPLRTVNGHGSSENPKSMKHNTAEDESTHAHAKISMQNLAKHSTGESSSSSTGSSNIVCNCFKEKTEPETVPDRTTPQNTPSKFSNVQTAIYQQCTPRKQHDQLTVNSTPCTPLQGRSPATTTTPTSLRKQVMTPKGNNLGMPFMPSYTQDELIDYLLSPDYKSLPGLEDRDSEQSGRSVTTPSSNGRRPTPQRIHKILERMKTVCAQSPQEKKVQREPDSAGAVDTSSRVVRDGKQKEEIYDDVEGVDTLTETDSTCDSTSGSSDLADIDSIESETLESTTMDDISDKSGHDQWARRKSAEAKPPEVTPARAKPVKTVKQSPSVMFARLKLSASGTNQTDTHALASPKISQVVKTDHVCTTTALAKSEQTFMFQPPMRKSKVDYTSGATLSNEIQTPAKNSKKPATTSTPNKRGKMTPLDISSISMIEETSTALRAKPKTAYNRLVYDNAVHKQKYRSRQECITEEDEGELSSSSGSSTAESSGDGDVTLKLAEQSPRKDGQQPGKSPSNRQKGFFSSPISKRLTLVSKSDRSKFTVRSSRRETPKKLNTSAIYVISSSSDEDPYSFRNQTAEKETRASREKSGVSHLGSRSRERQKVMKSAKARLQFEEIKAQVQSPSPKRKRSSSFFSPTDDGRGPGSKKLHTSRSPKRDKDWQPLHSKQDRSNNRPSVGSHTSSTASFVDVCQGPGKCTKSFCFSCISD